MQNDERHYFLLIFVYVIDMHGGAVGKYRNLVRFHIFFLSFPPCLHVSAVRSEVNLRKVRRKKLFRLSTGGNLIIVCSCIFVNSDYALSLF